MSENGDRIEHPPVDASEQRDIPTFDRLGIMDEREIDERSIQDLRKGTKDLLLSLSRGNDNGSLNINGLINDLVYSGAISFIELCNLVLEMKEKFLEYRNRYVENAQELHADVLYSLSARADSLSDYLSTKKDVSNKYDQRRFMRNAGDIDRLVRRTIKDLLQSPLTKQDFINKLLERIKD